MTVTEDEKIIDDFNARASEEAEQQGVTEQPEQTEQPPTDEEIVEKQARNKPTAATVLQKKTQLPEEKLEQRIDQILAKNAGKIDEAELRARVAAVLEHKDAISEADLVQIQDAILREYDAKKAEEEENQATTLQPPAVLGQQAAIVGDRLGKWADAAAALKTPGGIGLLIGVLLFMIWVMIPTKNGQTRMQLLWAVITGQAQWAPKEEQALTQVAQASSSASTNNQGGGGMSGGLPSFLAFTFED